MPISLPAVRLAALGPAAAALLACSGSDPVPDPEPDPEPTAPATFSPTAGGGVCVSPQHAASVAVVPFGGQGQSANHAVRITPVDPR